MFWRSYSNANRWSFSMIFIFSILDTTSQVMQKVLIGSLLAGYVYIVGSILWPRYKF